MRKRYGRVVKPNRNPNFDYSNVILELCTPTTSVVPRFTHISCLAPRIASSHCFSCVASLGATLPRSKSNSFPPMQEADLRRAERAKLEDLCELVFTVRDLDGKDQMLVMLKRNGTLFYFDPNRKDWLAYCDGSRLSQVLKKQRDPFGRPPGLRPLSDDEVELPEDLKLFPGADQQLYLCARYGFSKEWRAYCEQQSKMPASCYWASNKQRPLRTSVCKAHGI